jgi:hypothetical protein
MVELFLDYPQVSRLEWQGPRAGLSYMKVTYSNGLTSEAGTPNPDQGGVINFPSYS